MKKEKQTLNPEQLELLDFHFFHSDFKMSDDYKEKRDKVDSAEISSSCKYGLQIENEVVGILVNISFKGKGENNEELGVTAYFSIEYLFHVENLSEYISQKDNTQTISGTLLTALAGIAYSTSRGSIYEKLNGTPLRDFLLPVVDPANLFGG